MTRTQKTEQTFELVKHFPMQPFGRHAVKYCIELRVAKNHDGPHVPLSGCELVEQIDAEGKDLLCRLKLARFDSMGRFEVDYAALRTHLRTVCGWNGTDVENATWKAVVSTLREREQPQEPEPLSRRARIVYERLLVLKAHEAMTFPEIQDYYESKTEKSLDEGTWKDLKRELDPYGLANRPKVGYYIRPPKN